MLNKLYIILLFLLLIGCGRNNDTSTKISDIESTFDNKSMFHNDDVVLATTDSIRDLYFRDLWGLKIPTHFEFPGFYKDTINEKYIKLIMMEEDEAIERLQRIDKDKRFAFIQDSLITTFELFPKKRKLDYSYNEIIKFKYLECNDKDREYDYYFKNDSIAKSKYIKKLDKNKQIVFDLKFSNQKFSVPDLNVYVVDNIDFSIQDFNNKWISSDTLKIELESFALDCFQIVDYKKNDFVLIFLSGSNVGMIHYSYTYLIKIDMSKDRNLKYEIMTL